MIDFDDFKKKMLAAKSGMVDATSSQNNDAKDGVDTYQKEWEKDAFLNYSNTWKEDVNAKENGWKQKINMKDYKNDYKCTMHQRKNPASGVDLIRVHCFFKGVQCEHIVDYFMNPPPNKMIKEFKDLEIFPNGDKITYTRFKIPMMSEREAIAKYSHKKMDDGSIFITVQSCEHADAPKVKGAIRMF